MSIIAFILYHDSKWEEYVYIKNNKKKSKNKTSVAMERKLIIKQSKAKKT